MALRVQMDSFSKNDTELFSLLRDELPRLADLNFVYEQASLTNKQQLILLVFNRFLYYSEGSFRTLFIVPQFVHNELMMSEKKLLFIYKKKGIL